MNFLNTLKVLNYHPITKRRKTNTFLKYLKYRLLHKLFGHPFLYSFSSFSNSIKIIIKDIEQYQIIYTNGLPEFYEQSFLLHFIRPDDTFIDVGANRGLFCLTASGYGKANSIAFEPVPDTFRDLDENVRLNNLNNKIRLINAGIAAKTASASFSTGHGSANHIIKDNQHGNENVVTIKVYSLDEIIPAITTPALMKIDVEGFEYEVLTGASKVLQNPLLKAIIIELNGASQKYNYKEEDIHQILVEAGFKPYRYYPLTRELIEQSSFRSFIEKKYMSDNTIYIRDLEFVKERIFSADKLIVNNTIF